MDKELKIAYILPGVFVAGGVAIVLNHVNRLKKRGYNTSIIVEKGTTEIDWFNNNVPVTTLGDVLKSKERFDIIIATHWTTVKYLKHIKSKRKIYFVQSDERRFIPVVEDIKGCEETYKSNFEFMTEAKWIQRWLWEEFKKESYYVPNALDPTVFKKVKLDKKSLKKRPVVLLEGPLDVPFKGVSVAFDAVKDLDCDIWLVASGGVPSPEMKKRIKKISFRVPMEEMKKYYSGADVFLKMSRVEGFFGPPLEAMACKCAVVVSMCTGFDEYIKNENNALVVEMGDVEAAKNAVDRLLKDKAMRAKLVKNGFETSRQWNWDHSIDLLEKVMIGAPIKKYYTTNNPAVYDYKKTMSDTRYLAELLEPHVQNERRLHGEVVKLRETLKNKVLRKIGHWRYERKIKTKGRR